MGISWSGRRRNNSCMHNHPPPQPAPHPPHIVPSSYFYASELPALLPPSNIPVPQPQNYVFASNPPYPPSPYPASNLCNFYPTRASIQAYPFHAPPGGYNSFNHANHMMFRPNCLPAQFSHTNGWSAVPPSSPPPPYVEHQNAKNVRNDVNVHKGTLRLEVDEHNPDHHLVSFVFDALSDGSITISYFAKEEPNCKFVPLFPEASMPVTIPFQKGTGQKFRQPSGTGIDLGFFELDDLSKAYSGEDVFPLVISAQTGSQSIHTEQHLSDPVSGSSPHMQVTQAVLEKDNEEAPFLVRVIKQILFFGGIRYVLHDIYGMGNPGAERFNNDDSGKECVICMTEPKNTAVIPCRHMCMCSECAKALRLQSNKCPICRQPFEKLLEIKINNDGH